jgi:2-keto-4-pentenoate hydratase
MNTTRESFADALLHATLEHRPIPVPADLAADFTIADGQATAARNSTRLLERIGGRVTGWKLGATNPAALARLGLEHPFVGPVFSARTHAQPATLPRSDFVVCVVEVELAVRMRADVGGDGRAATREAIAAAVDEAFPVIEIADSRLVDWTSVRPGFIYADLGFAGALITGAPIAGWRDVDFTAAKVHVTVNGDQVREGTGAAVMGHPLDALAGMVAHIPGGLRAGQVVSTGTWIAPHFGQRGDRIVADFGALGRVAVDLA